MNLSPQKIKVIVEAALLAAEQPLSLERLSLLFTEGEVSHEGLVTAITELEQDCAARGIELKEVASGYRLQVRPELGEWIARLWEEKAPRYTRALLETMALIAYKQPITRAEIEEVRGVAVSTHVVKTLLDREWVRVVGHRDVPGRPALFGTTRAFLDYFNLRSLDELPPLAEVRNLEDIQVSAAMENALAQALQHHAPQQMELRELAEPTELASTDELNRSVSLLSEDGHEASNEESLDQEPPAGAGGGRIA